MVVVIAKIRLKVEAVHVTLHWRRETGGERAQERGEG